jgi:transposase
MRIAPVITLSPEQRTVLESQVRSRSLPLRVVERSRIVLFAAEGRQDKDIAVLLSMTPKKVSRWRKRFLALSVAGLLQDAPRPGRNPTISARLTQRVVTMTTRQQPTNATHWSTRIMAAAVGISEASVRRIWHAHGLKPHRVETFKISNDPAFAEKLEDIVGLYLNPPEHALVLCVDEKSQIQALDRTQPGLPLKRGRGATMTHDYKRNGTATLFAALNAANGEVYGLCQERHRHQEWLKFLRLLDQNMPAHLELHLIGDNYATHKHSCSDPNIRALCQAGNSSPYGNLPSIFNNLGSWDPLNIVWVWSREDTPQGFMFLLPPRAGGCIYVLANPCGGVPANPIVPANPCNRAGNAPDPSVYQAKGQAAQTNRDQRLLLHFPVA